MELDLSVNPPVYRRADGVGGEKVLVDTSTAQTLTGKTLTAPALSAVTITGTSTIGTGMTITTPVLSGSVTGTYTLAGTPTITAPAISAPVITDLGAASTGVMYCKTVLFTEDATSVTHTGTIPIPAGATINDITFRTITAWTDTAVACIIGDNEDPDGYFASFDVDATDLLVGEVLSVKGGVQTWGGRLGVYLVSATGRMGSTTAGNSGLYYGSANNIIAVVSVTTPSGTAGRSLLSVSYSVGTAIAPVLA